MSDLDGMMFALAVRSGKEERIAEYLEKHPGWASGSSMGVPFLCQAAGRDGPEALEAVLLLIAYGADPADEDSDGDNAYDSARNRDVRLLLSQVIAISDENERRQFAISELRNVQERRKIEEATQKQREEDRARVLAEQQAEEQRRQKIMSDRHGRGLCVMCGKPLGFLARITRNRHRDCNQFQES